MKKQVKIVMGIVIIVVMFALIYAVSFNPHLFVFNNSNEQYQPSSIPVFHLDIAGLLSMNHSKEWAIEIAKLQEGGNRGMIDVSDDVELDEINGESIWKVNVSRKGGGEKWQVWVNVKTGMSKKTMQTEPVEGETQWRSLDELIVSYIAWFNLGNGAYMKKPYKTQLEGEAVWKVPICNLTFTEPGHYDPQYYAAGELLGYVYVNPQTWNSKQAGKEPNELVYHDQWINLRQLEIESTQGKE